MALRIIITMDTSTNRASAEQEHPALLRSQTYNMQTHTQRDFSMNPKNKKIKINTSILFLGLAFPYLTLASTLIIILQSKTICCSPIGSSLKGVTTANRMILICSDGLAEIFYTGFTS